MVESELVATAVHVAELADVVEIPPTELPAPDGAVNAKVITLPEVQLELLIQYCASILTAD